MSKIDGPVCECCGECICDNERIESMGMYGILACWQCMDVSGKEGEHVGNE